MNTPLIARAWTHARQWLWPAARAPRASDHQLVERVMTERERLARLSDEALAAVTAELRASVSTGLPVEDERIAVAGLATMGEALRRATGNVPFDVQYLAALALARGCVAQMETGEGKTLSTALAAYLRALVGTGVHVATPNRYLADRDFETLAPAFGLAGTSVGLLPDVGPAEAKRAAYSAEITYGTGYEFGFDYLRDQLSLLAECGARLGERLQARLVEKQKDAGVLQTRRGSAIIDEIDSVLLDEAGLPLVLSDSQFAASGTAELYVRAREVAKGLRTPEHFSIDLATRRVGLSAAGRTIVQAAAPSGDQAWARPWPGYVEAALHAEYLLDRDVDYVVQQQQVWLIDPHTGRIFPDRFLQGGLQQAVEVKERLAPSAERATAARISRQRFFRRYPFLSGTTGTAVGAERELWGLYRLPVVTIPRRKPAQRDVWPERYFVGAAAKHAAIVIEVARLVRQGRPILIGTRTIESSQQIAREIERASVQYQLLNGLQDRSEAEVVARAGQAGRVTIATNMAGRGTDIRLGDGVAVAGGLHVIVAERHASSRVDRQLIGRAARQGDPGSCQAFVSGDDDLLLRHAPNLARRMKGSPSVAGEIQANLSAQVNEAQRAAEVAQVSARQQLLVHDDWMDGLLGELLGEQELDPL